VNEIGQRTGLTTSGNAFPNLPSWFWGPDSLGQVTSADHSTGTTSDRAYLYDTIGNRKKSADSLTLPTADNYTTNALNQYISRSVGVSPTLNPEYDFDGNAKAYPLPVAPTTNSTRTWDAENRLISSTVGNLTTTYAYDAKSRRIAKTTGTNNTLYVYDAWNCIAEYSGTILSKSNLWGTDLSGSMQGAGGVGGLLLITDHSAMITAHYPTYDGNGNVSEYLDNSGSVVAHYEYDPYGNTLLANGPKAGDFSSRFSTKPQDFETGLYYYGYRYYDPLTGRWPSRDLIEERGGVNLQAFVVNDGINRWDILGNMTPHGWGPKLPPTPYKPPDTSDGLSYPEGAGHYYAGNGTPVTVPFSEVDPGWGVDDFIDPCSYDYGKHPIDEAKPYELFNGIESFNTNAGPGRIAIKLVGELTVTKEQSSGGGCKKWSFSGTQSATSDEFDFEDRQWGERDPNAGFHMGPFGNPSLNLPWRESVTRLIGLGGGENYTVNFSGDRKSNENGECSE
jgi:RHS repeat-associated protein